MKNPPAARTDADEPGKSREVSPILLDAGSGEIGGIDPPRTRAAD